MKKWMTIMVLACVTVLLTACGGSAVTKEEKAAQLRPDIDSITAVQRAIDEYQAETGVLPIKNSEEYTDIYIKYQIDFSKLVPKYIAKSPLNSFEQGGLFQYVLWDVEEDPTVKLVDLRMPEKIRELKIRLLSEEYPAYGETVGNYVYKINHKKLGYDAELSVQSPFTTNLLPLIVTGEGDVYIDYTLDIQKAINDFSGSIGPGDDVRNLLITDENYFLPAYSLPYTVDDKNEVVFDYDAVQSMADKREKRLKEYEKQQATENNK